MSASSEHGLSPAGGVNAGALICGLYMDTRGNLQQRAACVSSTEVGVEMVVHGGRRARQPTGGAHDEARRRGL